MMRTAPLPAILAEQKAVLDQVETQALSELCDHMLAAPRILLYGVGRNGLVLQCLAMRLMHLGFEAHFVGQLSAPPIGAGDILLTAASLGSLPSVDAMARSAKQHGAWLAAFSARPEKVPLADLVIRLPGQTMDDPQVSPLLLGGAFELALLILCEWIAIELKERRAIPAADIRARHTNLL